MPNHNIDISEESGVRYLHFGSEWVQGAMRIARPWSLELTYTREMMAGLLLYPEPWPRHCLIVGLGAASLVRFIHRHLPETQVTVVEINPGVLAAAQHFFKLPPVSERLSIHLANAVEWIVNAPGEHFDLVLLDGFGADGRPGKLDSPSFYQQCRRILGEQGLLVCNLLSHSRSFHAAARRIAEAFDKRSLVFPSCDSGNAIAFAATGFPVHTTLDDMRIRAEGLRALTGLDLRPTVSRLQLTKSLPDGHLHL